MKKFLLILLILLASPTFADEPREWDIPTVPVATPTPTHYPRVQYTVHDQHHPWTYIRAQIALGEGSSVMVRLAGLNAPLFWQYVVTDPRLLVGGNYVCPMHRRDLCMRIVDP